MTLAELLRELADCLAEMPSLAERNVIVRGPNHETDEAEVVCVTNEDGDTRVVVSGRNWEVR
jgi:hypothetical protein